MNEYERDKGISAADRAYDSHGPREKLFNAVPATGEARAAFVERVALRLAIDAAFTSEPEAAGMPAHAEARVRAAYERGSQGMDSDALALDTPTPWLAAEAAFAGDVSFLMKLMGRNVSMPTPRFLRYVADALGTRLAVVRQHFEIPPILALAGVERKASSKPSGPQVEDFATAVQASGVPDELKARWLAG